MVTKTRRNRSKIIRLLIFAVILSAASSAAMADNTTCLRAGVILGRPHFSIRQTTDVAGAPVHFMTGRPKDNIGWYFEAERLRPTNRFFGFGLMAGARFWRTGYWLNWEMPEQGVSLDPLESRWDAVYIHGGGLVWIGFGPLRIVPSVNLIAGSSSFELKSGSQTESGSDPFIGIMPGIEGRVKIWRAISCAAGYRTDLILNRSPDYEVEPGVTLVGAHSAAPEELYFGISFWER